MCVLCTLYFHCISVCLVATLFYCYVYLAIQLLGLQICYNKVELVELVRKFKLFFTISLSSHCQGQGQKSPRSQSFLQFSIIHRLVTLHQFPIAIVFPSFCCRHARTRAHRTDRTTPASLSVAGAQKNIFSTLYRRFTKQ